MNIMFVAANAVAIVGVFNGKGPPVPIPNTEVKLTSADNTCLETDREDRSMPTQKAATIRLRPFCCLLHGDLGAVLLTFFQRSVYWW